MENRVSLFENKKMKEIILWTIKRKKTIIIVYSLLLLLAFPGAELYLLFIMNNKGYIADYTSTIMDGLVGMAGTVFTALSILFSTIITANAFSYMHNKRQVDLFGSLPMSRQGMFMARYLYAVIASIGPIIITGLLGAILTFSWEGAKETLIILGIIIISVIGNVSYVAFVSVCSGTIADFIVGYVAINGIYPILMMMCTSFPSEVIPGLKENYVPAMIYTLLSPIAACFVGIFGDSQSMHCIWWSIISIVLLACSYYLAKKRKAESAQNAYAFYPVDFAIKFAICFTAGTCMGMVLGGTDQKDVVNINIWFGVGFVIGTVVSNVILHLISYRGRYNVRKGSFESLVTVIVAVVYFFSIANGGWGYDKRMPDFDDINSVYISVDKEEKFMINGEDVLKEYKDDESYIREVYNLHHKIIQSYSNKKVSGMYAIVSDNYSYYFEDISTVEIEYVLKNGRTMRREYNDVIISIPQTLRNSEVDNRDKLIKIPVEYVRDITVSDNYGNIIGEIWREEDKLCEIVQALKKDVEELGIKEDVGKLYTIELSYENYEYGYNVTSCSVDVPESFVNTITALRKRGYLNKDFRKCLSMGNFLNDYGLEYRTGEENIYFKLPQVWDDNEEVHCAIRGYVNGFEPELLLAVDEEKTKCENIGNGVYKYTIPIIESDKSFARRDIIFYQYTEEDVNCTPFVLLSDEGNMLHAEKRSDVWNEDDEYVGEYDVEWIKYVE